MQKTPATLASEMLSDLQCRCRRLERALFVSVVMMLILAGWGMASKIRRR